MQRADGKRWLAPVGACIALSGLCLVLLWFSASGSGGRPLLGRPYGGHGGFGSSPCSFANPGLAKWMLDATRKGALLPRSTNFESFVEEVRVALEQHHLPLRPIDYLFDAAAFPTGTWQQPLHPSCAGDFMEFGVFEAGSTNKTARWRRRECHASCPPVYGFDTFSGLPEAWAQDQEGGNFGQGSFSLGGTFPPVEDNIHLVKGLFSESIPPFLNLQREMMGIGRDPQHEMPLAYLHIDCDLYGGSRDALTLLSHKIMPGTVILFDELQNYEAYKEHEIKALFEWLHVSGAKIAPIGIKGPLVNQTYAFDKDIKIREHPQEHQSAAFVVVQKPGSTMRVAW